MLNATTSGAYDSAVLGSEPEDFWPLSDTAGPLATDLIGSAATSARRRHPATYSSVMLGVPGPSGYADGTAAGFSGSGSQVSIPGGYFSGTGAESVELWFQTTRSGTLLSSTSGSGGEPVQIWIDSAGCLWATIDGATLPGSCGTSAITDGKWHQVVVTLSGPSSTSSIGSSGPGQEAILYIDGKHVNQEGVTTGATAAAGYTALIGNGSDGDALTKVIDALGASETNVMGTTTDYTYYANNLLASSYVAVAGGGEEDVTSDTYNPVGLVISETSPGGLVTDTSYDADSQITSLTVDPGGADRKNLTTTYARRAWPGHHADRPGRQHHPRPERRGRPVGRRHRPGRARPVRHRRRAGDGQPGDHHRLRHLR